MRRNMEGEDLLLRDSLLLARQVAHHERRAQRAEQGQQRAEQERQQAEQERLQAQQERLQAERQLDRAIRRLHGLGQNTEAIAAALAVDAEQVRRILST